ncbi:unnamed protein product [Schistosoma mattheei]|uniref:Uncharacterized protein n=1 Tax=Schistosoma mattheei TaxID=31246 RepID=A0A183P0C9_9TREM|nr:unnamed protein product [Schistosoma mattheei]
MFILISLLIADAAVFLTWIYKDPKTSVGMFLDELQRVQIQYLGAETNNFPTLLFNYVHQHFHCCGMNDYTEWLNSTIKWKRMVTYDNITYEIKIPISCCPNLTNDRLPDCARLNSNYPPFIQGCGEILTYNPIFDTTSISERFYTLVYFVAHRMWSILVVTATSAFSASAGILSGPAALPLLICLTAMLISSIVGEPTLIGRSMGAASILDGFSGAGRFKSSLKCSTRLFCCSSMLVITLPFLLFTGRSGSRRFPESFFIMSYSCFMFPSLAAFSAVVAKSPTYLRFFPERFVDADMVDLVLCMRLCGNMVPPMTSLLKAHRFANLSHHFCSVLPVRVVP